MTKKKKVLLTDKQHADFVEGKAETCPFCGGGGLYPPTRPRRTDRNSAIHALLECPTCRSLVLVRYELVGIVSSQLKEKG